MDITSYFWAALGLPVLGSIYLIIEGYKVHKLFAILAVCSAGKDVTDLVK